VNGRKLTIKFGHSDTYLTTEMKMFAQA